MYTSEINYFIAAIAGVLSLSLVLGGAATANENVCDMKILNRPGCEVGDFGRPGQTWHESPHEIQIIDFKPVVRDFREAPQQSQPKEPPRPQADEEQQQTD